MSWDTNFVVVNNVSKPKQSKPKRYANGIDTLKSGLKKRWLGVKKHPIDEPICYANGICLSACLIGCFVTFPIGLAGVAIVTTLGTVDAALIGICIATLEIASLVPVVERKINKD